MLFLFIKQLLLSKATCNWDSRISQSLEQHGLRVLLKGPRMTSLCQPRNLNRFPYISNTNPPSCTTPWAKKMLPLALNWNCSQIQVSFKLEGYSSLQIVSWCFNLRVHTFLAERHMFCKTCAHSVRGGDPVSVKSLNTTQALLFELMAASSLK